MVKKIDINETITIVELADSTGIQIKYSPTVLGGRADLIKISRAVLEFKLVRSTQQKYGVYFENALKEQEYLVDEFLGINSLTDDETSSGMKTVCIDITDELQTCLDNNSDLYLKILNMVATDLVADSLRVVYECYYKKQIVTEQANIPIDAGKAGIGNVNLVTGVLKFGFEDVKTNSKVLPIGVKHIFHSLDVGCENEVFPYLDELTSDKIKLLPNNCCGNGWRTNYHQYIIKEEASFGNFSDKETCNRYTYINAEGEYIVFEEKYSYVDEESVKHYLPLNKVHVAQDGELSYLNELGVKYIVSKETISDSGLNLISKYEKMKGVSLLSQENEDVQNLQNEINSYNKALADLHHQKNYTLKAIELLKLSNEITLKNNELQSISLKNESLDLKLQDELKPYNDEYRKLYKQYSELVDDRAYYYVDIEEKPDVKAIYPTSKERDLKIAFEEQSDKATELSNSATYGLNSDDDCVLKRRKESLVIQENVFEMNKKYSSEQYLNELVRLEKQVVSIDENISEYDKIILQKTYQLSKLQEQNPELMLTDTNGNIMAFNQTATKNIYKLFAVVDAYENQIQIIYDDNKITEIIDAEQHSILFSYENNLLKSLTDSNNRMIEFLYDANKNLETVKYPSGRTSNYCYDSEGHLVEVSNNNEIGCILSYENNKVVELKNYTNVEKFTNDTIKFLNQKEIKDILKIDYYDYEYTKVLNVATNKTECYVFDNLGKVVSKYDNVFKNNSILGNVNAVSIERQYENNYFKISEKNYAENLLDNLDLVSVTNGGVSEYYLGDTVACGEDVYAITLSDTRANNEFVVCTQEKPKIYKTLSSDIITKIKEKGITDLVFSGWAKADSAWVKRHCTDYKNHFDENLSLNDLEQLLINNSDEYKDARRFELRAELTYLSNGEEIIVEQYCSFDWMNTEWQYCSFPVTIDEENCGVLSGITLYFDYSNNTGVANFYNMSLKESDWQYAEFIKGYKTYEESSNSKYITHYKYNDKKQLVKTILQDKTSNATYESSYIYNRNNALAKSVDYNGIITENVYNDKGVKIKTKTYHMDEPANKYYSETILDDKGQKNIDLNEFGDKVNDIKYIDNTGIVESVIDVNGNTVSYGYDNFDDTLLHTSTTIDGNVNSNNMHYNSDLLTCLTHNGFDVKFEFNGIGQKTKTLIADKNYSETVYEEIKEFQIQENNSSVEVIVGHKTTTTNAIGEKFIVYTNLQDNVTKIEFVDVNNVISTVVDNKYDTYENLISTTDNIFNSSTNYFYDELGRNVKKEYMQTELLISLENVYDEKDNVVKTKFSLGNSIYETNFEYDYTNPNQKLKSINLGDISESYTYDKLDRIRSTNLGDFYSKHFNYLQKGDHTSDVVSSETFGENGIVKSTLKYSYDEKGNVTKVFENGELINRYAYDGLSRLIREDNKKLNKTTLFEYDCGGNILSKVVYDYTTKETKYLLDGEVITYTYPVSGWKDQLQQYNNEKFEYDNMGNPTKYRDNVLEWSHGRRLDKFNNNITYNYNADGIRTSKTVNGKTTNYYLDGTKILAQNDGNLLTFYYGAEGVIGFKYHGVGDYYYKKNIFGDIISIYDSSKQEIVKYVYDAWGNHNTYVLNDGEYFDISQEISYTTSGLNNKTIAELNPFRYRGYYYDAETNLYYLNSRYYDAELGRFINADDISFLDSDSFNGLNLYAYCCNNPVNDSDANGNWSWKKFWKAVGLTALAIVVVGAVTVATVLTAGTAAAAMGLAATSINAIMVSAAIGGTVAGGMAIIGQGVSNGFDNLDIISIAIDTFQGGALAAVSAGVAKVGTLGSKIAGIGFKSIINGSTEIFRGAKEGLTRSEINKNVLNVVRDTIILQSIISLVGCNGNKNYQPFGELLIDNGNFLRKQALITFATTMLKSIFKFLNGGYRK